MSDPIFATLAAVQREQGNAALVDRLVATLRESRNYHQLFDALLLRLKFTWGLPLAHPTSFEDVPADKRAAFEEAYVAAAREVGQLWLGEGAIPQAWMYLRTIREPAAVAAALEQLDPQARPSDEIIDIALHQGVAPVKGLELLLASHGTCTTITALDQMFLNFAPDVRGRCAALMVRRLYEDLRQTVEHEVQRRQPLAPPGQSLQELIAGRDWLFADDNYHIDVSHLHAVVRFSRALPPGAPELKLALQLADYGAHLAPQYQYAGEPPFEEFYPAHRQFLKALLNDQRDAALDYFRKQLQPEAHETENQLRAFTLVDLLRRIDDLPQAVDVATQYLRNIPDQAGFSLADLYRQAGRTDLLRELAEERADPVTFVAALLGSPGA